MAFSRKFNPWAKALQWVLSSATTAWGDITGKPSWVAGTEESFTTTLKNKLDGIVDPLIYKGVIDCSGNPNYPAASTGHVYKVSVAGKIGGASGPNVEVGDGLICNADSVAGNHATVGSYWNIIQVNIDGAVTGPASATDSNMVEYDGTSGKIVKDGSLTHDNVASAISLKHTQGTDTALGVMSADINMNSHKLTGLSVPSSNGDSIRATTKITETNLETAYDHSQVTSGNPHNVSASDVGAYSQEETNALFGGVNRSFFLSNDADGVIAGYSKLYDKKSSLGTLATITASAVSADDTLIEEFITESTQPDFTTLVAGIYDLHIHANVSAVTGNNTIRLYYKLYKRTTGDVETLLITSEQTNVLGTSETQYVIGGNLDEDETIDASDRLVLKIYANVDTVGGANPDVNLYVEGVTASRIAIKAEMSAFDSRYESKKTGASVTEFSIDGTLADNSDTAVPTEKAVKTYADTKIANVVDDTTPELGGEMDCGSHSIGFTEQAITSSSNEATVNWQNSNKAKLTLSENVTTFNFTAPSNPCNLLLRVIQDSSPRTISWPAAVKWAGGTAPTLTTTAGRIDIMTFYWSGSHYYGSYIQDFNIS